VGSNPAGSMNVCVLCFVSSLAGIVGSNPAGSMNVCLLCVVSSLAGIVGSNPAGDMDICLLYVLCVVSSLAGIVGSNPAGDMDICLLCVLCVVSSLAGIAGPKRYNFRKRKVMKHKMCVLSFSTFLSQTFAILRRPERELIKRLYWSSFRAPFIYSG
jgi:dolichol kinase